MFNFHALQARFLLCMILLLFVARFINEEALALELAGYFFEKTGKRSKATSHLVQAYHKYNAWGAAAKCDMLFHLVRKTFSDSAPSLEEFSRPASSFTAHKDDDDDATQKRALA